jgi:anti-anti-sigma factor
MEILETEFHPGRPSVLRVRGEIDVSTAQQFRTSLEEAVCSDPTVVIDMGGVTFFDASGLRVLLQVAATRNGAGPLPVIGGSRVARVLRIVGLSDLPSVEFREVGDTGGG